MSRAFRRAVAGAAALWAAWAGASPVVRLEPPTPAPGEVFRVRLGEGARACPCRVRLEGREFALWPARDGSWEGLGAVDREVSPGPHAVQVVDAAGRVVAEVRVQVRSRAYGVQKIRVDPRMVSPRGEDAERVEREARLIRSVLGTTTPRRLWAGGFSLPAQGPVSGPFGVRRVYNGTPRGYHSGLDIAAPRGSPVRAAASGRVALARELYYTGNTVFLDHGLGLYTAYFHMDTLSVREGQRVGAGTVLGTVGSTGRSTGPHLHWGVYVAGVKVDPLSLLRLLRAESDGLTGPGGRGE